MSYIANSSLNLAETKFYAIGFTPPFLLQVLQTLNVYPLEKYYEFMASSSGMDGTKMAPFIDIEQS